MRILIIQHRNKLKFDKKFQTGLSQPCNDEKDILEVTVEDYLTYIYKFASQMNTNLVNSRHGRKPFMTFKVKKKFPETYPESYQESMLKLFCKNNKGIYS